MNYQYEPLGDEYKFQTFLKDLFNAIHATNTFEEYGAKGNAQHGIDVYSPVLKTAIQAKKKDINRSPNAIVRELLFDLSETLELIKDFPHTIESLFFATTIKKNKKIQNACIEASRSHGINVILFSWDEIQNRLTDCLSVRNKYFPHLKEATSLDNSVNEKIERLESLISKLENQNASIKKQYRDIPYCEILLPAMPQDFLRNLIAIIMKISLYETFAQTKYRKFRCLFNFSLSHTQFGDGSSGPGYEIISGEVIFLANCSRLVKELQNDQDQFWNRFEEYNADPDFNKVRFRMEILPTEGLKVYDFEIDGQTGHYNIKVKNYEGIEYDKLDSLSAILPFIAQSTKPGINIIDFDKIKTHSASMKLFNHFLIEDSFKRNLLKINVDDFDDWDYEYYPSND
jgi:hypothetical protein